MKPPERPTASLTSNLQARTITGSQSNPAIAKLDERVSLAPLNPETVLRALLTQPEEADRQN